MTQQILPDNEVLQLENDDPHPTSGDCGVYLVSICLSIYLVDRSPQVRPLRQLGAQEEEWLREQ